MNETMKEPAMSIGKGELKMKDFWVDFSAAMLIRNCENKEEAKKIFFETLNNYNKNYENEIQFYDIDGVEERV